MIKFVYERDDNFRKYEPIVYAEVHVDEELAIDEITDVFKRFLLLKGFQPETVNELLGMEEDG